MRQSRKPSSMASAGESLPRFAASGMLTINQTGNQYFTKHLGGAMRTISMRMPSRNLVGAMMMMREWLDESRYDPASFVCERDGDSVVVHVGFRADDHAQAFLLRFADEPAADQAAA